MRSLTGQQTNIINSSLKKSYWLFEIDRDNDGTVDYYWSTQGRDWGGHTYSAKIMSFTPLVLTGGNPELGIITPTRITIQASFKDHNIGGIYASGFEGAAITVRLIGSTEADGEAELMAWRFKVVTAASVEQILTLECQDWFTLYLEGDYPNTKLVSDLFPADIMKNDNVCVPLVFGQPFFPIRWLTTSREGTYIDSTHLELQEGVSSLFSAGQFFLVNCGVNGIKRCWVQNSVLNDNAIAVSRNGVNDPAARQTITLEAGETYKISCFAKKIEEATVRVTLGATYLEWEAPTSWETSPRTFTRVAASTSEYLYLQVMTSNGTDGAAFDSVKVQKVNADGSLGPNLVTNGHFDAGITGWDAYNSATLTWSEGGGSTTINVTITAASDELTANLTSVHTDHYLLGPDSPIYAINRARTPREVNFKSTYLSTSYTFKQNTLVGSDGADYKVVQLICDDANKDGTNDANGFWGIVGKEIYDMPCRYARDDLVGYTNPANIANWIFQDWGIPAGEIDDTSRAAAAAIFSARGFELHIGLWYKMPREKFIARLFAVSGMIPVYRDKLGFKVLTKTSQKTITEDMVEPGFFQISRTFTQKQKDSGYITWQTSLEPVDQVNKSLIAAKSSTAKPSDTTIEVEWCLDSVKAQKAGKLTLQRILLRDKTITFTANSKLLALEPGDVITISPQNFGAEGSSYDCVISTMRIHEDLGVEVEAVRFSDALDDWGDLSANELTIAEALTERGYSPVYQSAVNDANGSAGTAANVITQTVQIGPGDVLIFTPAASASAPTHVAKKGTVYVTSECIVYVNKDDSTTWEKIGAQ